MVSLLVPTPYPDRKTGGERTMFGLSDEILSVWRNKPSQSRKQ
jgi:hypothetical protein